ncbi:MAG: CotH kinase family protein [Bacteroidaceae bacterium]|nr:CotH kinase family protein [Bacteroidaceae bacterium]
MRKRNIGRLLLMTTFCVILPLQSLYAEKVDGKLTGTVMGSNANERSWIGLDLGMPHVITLVGWKPRFDGSDVVLGLFEGSNREDFMDAIPLFMITDGGNAGVFSYTGVFVSRGFRYVRWCAPADCQSNVAEVEFYGHESVGDDSHFYQLTNLPTLSYHTYSGKEPYDKVHELESEMCIIYDDGTRLQEYPILVRERGNGSRYELFKKRPYRVKFNDGKSHHMLKGSPLESPAKAKKWTLIPNWRDKSLMRNNIAFEMSRRLGLSYTPWIQNVDVIVNGEYKGNYQLCDQVTVDPNRVDITNMESWDVDDTSITGGYLLEITSPGEAYHFYSNQGGIPVDIKSPDSDDIVSEQFSYIRDAFNEMESKLWASNYQHPEKGYRSKLDLGSFLRYFLVGEFAGNTDAMWSLYLYKERSDDLFHFGPVWDFDLSMDNDQRVYPANGKSNWLFNYGSAVTGIRDFVNRILSDPYATETLGSIWKNMRDSGAFGQDSLRAYVDSLGTVMDKSQKLNFTRWDNLDQLLTLQQFAPGTYQGELDIIKNYLNERIRWIDKKLGYKDYDDDDIPTDTLLIISSPEDFLAFQKAVNYYGLTGLNGRIEADLDLTSVSSKMEPIGTTGNPYVGRFDGQGHTLSGLTMKSSSNYVGLFGVVGGGAIIKNFVLDETCSIRGNAFVGIIGGSNGSGTVTMECLGNEGSVTAINQNAGGIFGCNMSGAATPIFLNCYVTGPVKGGRESGQITGYAAGGYAYNCYASGTIEGYYYKDMSDTMLRGRPQSSNCYSTYPDKKAILVEESQVTSGELCYMLNEGDDQGKPVWFQTLGQDDYPVLNATHFEILLADDGTYYNEDPDILTAPFWAKEYVSYSIMGIPTAGKEKGIRIIRTRDDRTYKVLKK